MLNYVKIYNRKTGLLGFVILRLKWYVGNKFHACDKKNDD